MLMIPFEIVVKGLRLEWYLLCDGVEDNVLRVDSLSCKMSKSVERSEKFFSTYLTMKSLKITTSNASYHTQIKH